MQDTGAQRVFHIPAEPGSSIASVFNELALIVGQAPPRFCASDSDDWVEFLKGKLSSVLGRRLQLLFPIPPKGASLCDIESNVTREWLAAGRLITEPLPPGYWAHALEEGK